MELVAILRALWRRRLLLAVGAIAIIALAVTFGASAPTRTGKATTRLMLDTGSSQLIGANPAGAESLTWRTQLLTELLTSDPIEARIASGTGISTDQLRIIEPLVLTPEVDTALPRHAAEAAVVTTEPYVVKAESDIEVPVVSIEATAPDRETAVRLAEVTSRVMQGEDQPVRTTGRQRFVVESARPIKSEEVVSRPPPVKAIGMAVVLLGLWCAILAALPAGFLARRRGVTAAS